MSLGRYVVRLYPRAWRERYEDEMLAMLEYCPGSLWDMLDLCVGALDAHLHPHLGLSETPLLERMKRMLGLLRASLLTIFCAWAAFILACMGFQKLNEYNGFSIAAQHSSLINLAFNLTTLGAVLTSVALPLGGLPILSSIIESARSHKRYGSLVLLATPLLACAIFIGAIFVLKALFPPVSQLSSLWQILLARGLFLGILFASALVSVGALCLAVVRSEIPAKHFRFALLPALLTILSMLLTLVATLIWGLGLQASAPQTFASHEGVFATPTSFSWLGVVITMALAVLIACVALVRGFSARSVLQSSAS